MAGSKVKIWVGLGAYVLASGVGTAMAQTSDADYSVHGKHGVQIGPGRYPWRPRAARAVKVERAAKAVKPANPMRSPASTTSRPILPTSR